ncbi:MAG: cell division protein FtsA, partial [Anaerolinea sp.]|nr:cell division protein FtsA [Anaerolinea sp.]
GASLLPGTKTLASRIFDLPVRIARPENLSGLADQLNNPAYSTSVGLLHWALMMSETTPAAGGKRPGKGGNFDWEAVKNFLKRLLP